jgi:hypothetical protein
VLNLPKPREHHPEREVGPSAVLAGSIIQGRRLAEAKGRDLFDDESDTAKKYQFLGDILRWRSATNPDHALYTIINSKVSFFSISKYPDNPIFFDRCFGCFLY